MQTRGKTWLKKVDYFFGRTLLVLISLIRKRKALPTNPLRIGVLVTAAIGDTILVSAIGRALKLRFPSAEIELIVGNSNQGIAPLLDGFDSWSQLQVMSPFKALKDLRSKKFDLLLDTGQWSRINALYSGLSGAYSLGFKTQGQGRHYLYDSFVEHSDQNHELKNFLRLTEKLGASDSKPGFKPVQLPKLDDKLVVCHLKPSGEKSWLKEWPVENWIRLFDWLIKHDYRIILTGGKEDSLFLSSVVAKAGNHPSIINRAGHDSLAETLRVLLSARLVVSVNTGTMHMAAVLNKPVVALHGPTNSRRWGPINPESIVVESKLECSPCLNLGFEYGCGQNDCMKSITVEEVINKCELVFSKDLTNSSFSH